MRQLLCGLEPLQQRVEGLIVADFFPGQCLVGDFFAGTVLGHHARRAGADAVDLSGDFRIGRDRLGEREKGKFDGGRSGIDRQDGFFHLRYFQSCVWRGRPGRR